jgi:type I restriction enzyme M protein
MNGQKHNEIVSFIWGIADDVLRDVFVRGKYRDIILPFTVIRRIDALLESTKTEVLSAYEFLKDQGIDDYSGLTAQSGYPFYNISPFTMRDLLDNPDSIDSNLELYLDGFDPFVQKIISKFKIRNQLETLSEANLTYSLIEKFTSKRINLSPEPAENDKGETVPGLTNLGMGYVFEELVRKFNEENNEEAGEHFTPRDIIELMTQAVFMPIKDQLKEGATYLVYDPACGTGGMLTESEKLIKKLFGESINTYLYGQEINPETYAICTADMLIKDEDPEKIYYGSTLSDDGFPNTKFDFMLTNPPYGKSWKNEKKEIVSSGRIKDHRFVHGTPRSSDGQLLFLSNMVSKMKHESELGSRIASVHNGSALFTGNAGQGESDIRKWIIENDYLEAIIALPERMFYNTGIATYIFILTNRKPEERKGKVQLIDATDMYAEMRKNLGDKSREFTNKDIQKILKTFLEFEETDNSKIFDNKDFGYQQITVERPLRLKAQLSDERIEKLRYAVTYVEEVMEWMFQKFGDEVYEDPKQFKKQVEKYMENNEIDLSSRYTKKLYSKKIWKEQRDLLELAKKIQGKLGDKEYSDFNVFRNDVKQALDELDVKTTKAERTSIFDAVSWADEEAEPVIKKKKKDGTIEYEPDSDLRDTENVPLKEDIEEYFEREVLPYVPDAWIDESKTKTGYEINFNKYFYEYQPLRDIEEIKADIMQIEQDTDGLLAEILES